MHTTLITGANRGLGLAYASSLLSNGQHVIATVRPERDTADLEAAATENGHLTVLVNPLETEEDIQSLVAGVSRATDTLDLLINNAGFMNEDTIEDVTLQNLLDNFLVNAAVPVLLVQGLLPLLRATDSATIVNISSSFASIGRKQAGMPSRYAYSMSKAALNMFTRTLAAEIEDEAILVVSIHPGWVRTALGGEAAQFDSHEAADAVLSTVAGLDRTQHGSFLLWDGRSFDW